MLLPSVGITCIIAGISFKLLFLVLFSYPATPLSHIIFLNFISCLPPSIHSHAHLRRLKFFQLWTVTAFRNCSYKRTVAQDSEFLNNGTCALCGQCLHSDLVMRPKPFLTALTCWRSPLRGREMDAQLWHQRKQHCSSSIHSCLSLPLLEIWGYMKYFMLITDVAGELVLNL